MARMTKNQKAINRQFDFTKSYTLAQAVALVKDITYTKFDASVDLAVHLGVDPRKADEMVRGTVILPSGTGKDKKILVLCTPEKEKEAKEAGADYVGLEDYLRKIEEGWIDIDVIVTIPEVMVKVGRLGKILGPRGLMPNPKSGTVTTEIGKAVQAIKSGKIEYKVDKYGIIHASIGRISFSNEALLDNAKELLNALIKAKPASAKGSYLKHISLGSTMSRGITINNIIPNVGF